MLNVLLAGVGGQGTVLAAKVLASAAQSKRWAVRACVKPQFVALNLAAIDEAARQAAALG